MGIRSAGEDVVHSYSLDSNFRRYVYTLIAVISFAIPAWVSGARDLLGLPVAFSYPLSFGITFGLLFWIVDKWLWKIPFFRRSVPDLSGKWELEGVSSFNDQSFSGIVTIAQSLTAIEIHGEFKESTSRSVLAGICANHAVPIFRYAFENTPKNMSNDQLHRHPGLIELRIEDSNLMRGDYFSGKHRLRYGEITLRRANDA